MEAADLNRLTFKRKTSDETYRLEGGAIYGPNSKKVALTRLQERIAYRFLSSPTARLSADQVQRELSEATINSGDETAYRKHITNVSKLFQESFGFPLFDSRLNVGIRSGGARSRRAEYRLSEGIEVGGELNFEATPEMSLAAYRLALAGRPAWFKIRPILASGADLDIESLYVELFLRPWENSPLPGVSQRGVLSEQEAPRNAAASHRVTAESLLARVLPRTVVVGPPGSGKTTLLKWICAYLLKDWTDEQLTPIPVSLRDFASSLQAGRVNGLLEYALTTVFDKETAASHLRVIQESPEGFKGLYLLDGLDEVPADMRSAVLRGVDEINDKCTVLITTRISAVAYLTRYPRAEIFEVGALADEAVAELCARLGEAKGLAELVPGLLKLIENSPTLWPLAGNPYLLTLLCEVVFASQELPVITDVSPLWVLTQAVDLIRTNYNVNYPDDPLSARGLEKIARLAHALSFGRTKRTSFEPESQLKQSAAKFSASPMGRSRFFNALGIGSTSFAFVHLRLQEFLAARWTTQNETIGRTWFNRYLLSRTWREEAQFAAAMLIHTGETGRSFRSALRDLVENPDKAGESIRCVSAVLAAAGIRDGGSINIGVDLRPILWQRITSESPFITEDSQALLELDPEWMVREVLSLKMPDDTLLSHLYRFLPLRLRKAELDPHLAGSPVLSWMIGLPGRGFPSVEDLDAAGFEVVNDSLPEPQRTRALRDLGSARASSQVTRIIPLLNGKSEELATAAAETLGKIGGRAAAVALATKLIALDEKTARKLPGLIAALLNALTADGYGTIEPHSRDLLVSYVNQASITCDNLEVVLSALIGTPLPNPPEKIIEILSAQDKPTISLQKTAASTLHGVTDPGFLARALEVLKAGTSHKLRDYILASVPFVPTGFNGADFLWQLCRSSSAVSASHALLLIFRTVGRYPQHSLSAELTRYIEESLSAVCEGAECTPVQKQVLKGIRLMRSSQTVKQALMKIMRNPSLDSDALTLAADALAVQRLDAIEQRSLRQRLGRAVVSETKDPDLASALAVTLFAHRPDSGPYLYRTLNRNRKNVGERPAGNLLRAAHLSGHLIYEDRLIYPDGRTRSA